MAEKRLRAVVTEETYAVVARVIASEEFRSDDLATAYRISEGVRRSGRKPEVVDEEGCVSVRVFIGDRSPDSEFDEAADAMLEASSW